MKNKELEQQEQTIAERVEEWKKKQDATNTKRSPDIRELDSQRMVIGRTTGDRIAAIVALPFVIFLIVIIAVQFIHVILACLVGILIGLFILRVILGGNIVIDKSTKTITTSKYSLFLTNRQRVIPFSHVRNVVIDYQKIASGGGGQYGGGGWHDEWKVSLNVGKKIKVKRTTKKENMFQLASDISKIIGTELVDNSAKPESTLQRFLRRPIGKGFFRKGGTRE